MSRRVRVGGPSSLSDGDLSKRVFVMERIARKSSSFAEAEEWERHQYRSMTPSERMRVARELKDRLFPGKQPDVRQCPPSKRTR